MAHVTIADQIDACTLAHRRLLTLIEEVDDTRAAAPSRLPGWTVGHVLTHLARNADSHVHAFDGAGRGEVWPRYPGGDDQRDRDIEAGAARAAGELRADVAAALERLEHAWETATPTAWSGECRGSDSVQLIADLPFLRRREVECHSVDLDLGYVPGAWPVDYCAQELRRAAEVLGPLPPAIAARSLPDRAAWVMGRLDVAGIDPPGQWF
jgi:maleylpyruvate isomerase